MKQTLYGLKTDKNLKIIYDVDTGSIDLVGAIKSSKQEIEVSEDKAFNVPAFISLNGLPYFPSKYEFTKGKLVFHSLAPPKSGIRVLNDLGILGERTKVMQVKVTIDQLEKYDQSKRARSPTQKQTMGMSAREHVEAAIKLGKLSIHSNDQLCWHWCHLIAFRLLPTERAQSKRNLVCGTSAFNGHMSNIEQALKIFVYETTFPVNLEITCTYLADTHLAIRMRYAIYNTKKQFLHREYFDAMTETLSDHGDYEIILEKLFEEFKRVSK